LQFVANTLGYLRSKARSFATWNGGETKQKGRLFFRPIRITPEDYTNLSAGERQLICVARAILKKSRILLIDEATANVDLTTDRMIQDVIADKFRDRTILTIAHRLNTVFNSDRLLVLQQGEVVFYDVPSHMNNLN
jgi:ABC-type multidrug transport system fused ATPase/permease subunit